MQVEPEPESSWVPKLRSTEFTTQMLWPFLISTRKFSLRDIGPPKKQWRYLFAPLVLLVDEKAEVVCWCRPVFRTMKYSREHYWPNPRESPTQSGPGVSHSDSHQPR